MFSAMEVDNEGLDEGIRQEIDGSEYVVTLLFEMRFKPSHALV